VRNGLDDLHVRQVRVLVKAALNSRARLVRRNETIPLAFHIGRPISLNFSLSRPMQWSRVVMGQDEDAKLITPDMIGGIPLPGVLCEELASSP
jgi:hypothetical protein